jgi:hypothetical protein
MVFAHADVVACVELSSALTHNDCASVNQFTAVGFDTKAF